MVRFSAILLMFGLVVIGCEEKGDGRIDGGQVIVDVPGDTQGDSDTENAPVTGAEWEVWIDGDSQEPNLPPEYSSLYVPPSGNGPRAVMVFEAHVDGTAEFQSAAWREAARDSGFALLTVEMNPADDSDDVAWRFPEEAARRLTRILEIAATTSGYEMLRSCPLILFGHSAASHLMTPPDFDISETDC